ncbi:hypothetical protein BH11BAC2_BH11BAC2_10460 [soil metagenome]
MLTNEDIQKINEALAPKLEKIDLKFDILDSKFETLRNDVFEAIDSLAQITKKGFDSIEERMVTKVEFQEFKKETHQNFFNLDTKLDSVEKRVKKIEVVIEPLILDNREIKKEINNLNQRVDHLGNPVKMKVE